MVEAFDAMGYHPFLTFFLGLVLLGVVHEITSIFKKCDCDKKKVEDEQ